MITDKKRIALREKILKPLIDEIPLLAMYPDKLAKYATFIEKLLGKK